MPPSRFYYKNQSFHNTTLNCGTTREDNDVLFRCSLSDCEIILKEPCWTSFYQSTFTNCRIISKKPASVSYPRCRWIGCTFLGDYGNSFGGLDDNECPMEPGPMLVDCDFSHATLIGLVLKNALLPTIKFPKWPNITFLEPGLHKEELCALKFSPQLQGWWYGYSSGFHVNYSSQSMNWDDLVETHRKPWHELIPPEDLEPYRDEFRETLSKLPYVII